MFTHTFDKGNNAIYECKYNANFYTTCGKNKFVYQNKVASTIDYEL